MITDKDIIYMEMARVWALNSKATRKKVGCIVVKDKRIISDGYNGTPSGFDNRCEHLRCGSSECIGNRSNLDYACSECEYFSCKTRPEVLHAEANAITKLAKSTNSSEGATLYVTCSPCFDCAKLIIQAGIIRVVYLEEYRDKSGLELLRKANIVVEQVDITLTQQITNIL